MRKQSFKKELGLFIYGYSMTLLLTCINTDLKK